MRLDLTTANRSGNQTIIVKDLCKRYEENVLFDHTDLLVSYKERVALVGPNGCGKTTFLRMLFGKELPDGGEARMGASVNYAYLPQKFHFKDEELSVVDCFREDLIILEGKAREYLAGYLFYGDSVFKKVKYLSGGERIRLMLAKLLYHDVNLLILDEPTNHLDIVSIEELEETLQTFEGTVFFISHDRYLINKIATRVVAVEDHAFHSYRGNYDEYVRVKKKEIVEVPIKPTKARKELSKKTVQRSTKGKGKQQSLEQKIQTIEDEIKQTEQEMEESSLAYYELSDLFGKKEALTMKLDLYMEEWLKEAE